MNTKHWLRFGISIPLLLLGAQLALGQMEKRENERYRLQKFQQAWPTIGDQAPEMEVRTLSGKSVRLSDYSDRHLVVIKGSYT